MPTTEELRKHFRLIKPVGKSNRRIVYHAHRRQDGLEYAVKVTDVQQMAPEARQDAVNEVRVLASLSHPHIISYKEAFLCGGSSLCLVTEYLPGGSLGDLIRRHAQRGCHLSEEAVWEHLLQLCAAVGCLHSCQVLHRDMKPDNVLVSWGAGGLKLVDLGSAKVMRSALTTSLSGTPLYFSPEQWARQPYGFKSDVYSLGCLLYELCALRHPHPAAGLRQLQAQVLLGAAPARIPEHYSTSLWEVISIMLLPSAAARPSMQQVLRHPEVARRLEAHTGPCLLGYNCQHPPPVMLRTIQALPLEQLNERLPPASYSMGQGVLAHLPPASRTADSDDAATALGLRHHEGCKGSAALVIAAAAAAAAVQPATGTHPPKLVAAAPPTPPRYEIRAHAGIPPKHLSLPAFCSPIVGTAQIQAAAVGECAKPAARRVLLLKSLPAAMAVPVAAHASWQSPGRAVAAGRQQAAFKPVLHPRYAALLNAHLASTRPATPATPAPGDGASAAPAAHSQRQPRIASSRDGGGGSITPPACGAVPTLVVGYPLRGAVVLAAPAQQDRQTWVLRFQAPWHSGNAVSPVAVTPAAAPPTQALSVMGKLLRVLRSRQGERTMSGKSSVNSAPSLECGAAPAQQLQASVSKATMAPAAAVQQSPNQRVHGGMLLRATRELATIFD